MTPRVRGLRPLCGIALISSAGIALTAHFLGAQPAPSDPLEASFARVVKPFFAKNCVSCHNSDLSTAGVRVDQLDAKLEDRHLKTWEAIRNRVRGGSMPPKG